MMEHPCPLYMQKLSLLTEAQSRTNSDGALAARTSPYTVRTDNTPRVRFSATVGEEPEVEVALV